MDKVEALEPVQRDDGRFYVPVRRVTSRPEDRTSDVVLRVASDAFVDQESAINYAQEVEAAINGQEWNIAEIVRYYSVVIQNGRSALDILNHAKGEMEEVEEEVTKLLDSRPEGEDGVVGEAIDVIQCMLDLIFRVRPLITAEQMAEIMTRKCEKWKTHYSHSLTRDRSKDG